MKEKASRIFKTFKDKMMGLYKRVRGENEEQAVEGQSEESSSLIEPETRISLIENQNLVRTYQVTSSLSHDVSNLILHTIRPVIQMRVRVIYSFSCSIHWGWNQVIQYHKTLSPNGTFMSLSQIEE